MFCNRLKVKNLLLVLAMIGVSTGALAECVQVTDRDLQHEPEETLAAVTWKAAFQNECDALIDIEITVDLVDNDDNSVYTLNAIESFSFREAREVEKLVYVPSRVVDQAVGIRISKKERGRQ